MTKHILYIILLLCSSTLMAQNNAIFGGGNADGYDKNNYLQPLFLSVDFSGGNGGGHAQDCYQQIPFLSVSFAGGNGDGYSQDCYTQTPFLTVAFGGGDNDGYTKDCYTQQSNLNNIFSGGIGGDGMLNGCANEPLGCFLTINLGNDTTFCDGQTLTLDAGSFPGGATYFWQDSSTAQTFLVDTTGIYYVTVVDTGGCTGVDSISVTVNPQPIVNLGNDTAFCAGNNLTLDAQNSGATYQWQNGVTAPFLNQTFTANTTGQYFVNVAFGICTAADTINVTVNPIITTNLSDSVICQGDSSLIFGTYQMVAGTYRDTILSSTMCDSILIQKLIVHPTFNNNLGTINICSGDSALILGNYETVAATYSDTLQTINGCDSIVNQTLSVSPSHNVSLGNDTVFCAGNSLILDAGAGATSYQWQNGVTTPFLNQTFTVNATGTYNVVTTLGACTTTDTINVTVNPIVTTNLSDSIICQGDSSLIFGTYQMVAGTYRDTLLSSTMCDSILVQQLIVNSTFNNNLGTLTVCAGDSALILGNYETVAATYSDTLQTINGCDSIVSQTLSVLSNSSVNLGNDTAFCAGNNLTLDAGAGATSYQWQNGVTVPFQNQTFTVNTTGTYFVVVTNGTCSATDTINVTVNPIVSTNLPDSIICQGDSSLIFGTYQMVAGTYRDTIVSSTMCDSILVQQLIVNPMFNNNLGTINICVGDSALILGNYETVAATYSDTLQTVNGCDSIVSQTLIVDTAPVVNLGNDTSFCSGNNLTLDAGAGATSYQWQNGVTAPFQNQTFTVNTTNTYYVTATIGVCSTTDSIDVTVILPVFTNLTDINICNNDSISIFGNFETTAGMYYDTLTSTLTMCDSILVQELFVNSNAVTNDTVIICTADSVFLGGAFQNVAGTYYDTLQTTTSCDSLIITELFIINGVTTNLADTICEGESLFVGGGLQTVSGLYYDSLQTVSGCDSLVITDLFVTPKPTVIVTANPNFIAAGASSQLNATGGETYSWTPANDLSCSTCANPIANPSETTIYTVTVDSNGCVVSDTVSITIDDEFLIPEGFSPNGDGNNDVFKILGIAKYPGNSITIINRWGNKVYEAAPYKGDWDGTNQFGVSFGKKLPTGTYFYILDLGKDGPNGDQLIKGYIYINK